MPRKRTRLVFSVFILLGLLKMLDQSKYENIPLSFYQRDDVVKISRELIGTVLFHQSADGLVGGRIVN